MGCTSNGGRVLNLSYLLGGLVGGAALFASSIGLSHAEDTKPQYRAAFAKLADFPLMAKTKLAWKKVSPSSQGPYVEMIYGSNNDPLETIRFFDSELAKLGCKTSEPFPAAATYGVSRSWACAPGYNNDTGVTLTSATASDGFKWWISVQYGLRGEYPGVYNSRAQANRDTVTLMPFDDEFRVR
jgi:hypothetical protein